LTQIIDHIPQQQYNNPKKKLKTLTNELSGNSMSTQTLNLITTNRQFKHIHQPYNSINYIYTIFSKIKHIHEPYTYMIKKKGQNRLPIWVSKSEVAGFDERPGRRWRRGFHMGGCAGGRKERGNPEDEKG